MYGKPVTLPGIAMVWGLTIMVMIYSIGHVSGAHFNPAVSIALASSRKFPFKQDCVLDISVNHLRDLCRSHNTIIMNGGTGRRGGSDPTEELTPIPECEPIRSSADTKNERSRHGSLSEAKAKSLGGRSLKHPWSASMASLGEIELIDSWSPRLEEERHMRNLPSETEETRKVKDIFGLQEKKENCWTFFDPAAQVYGGRIHESVELVEMISSYEIKAASIRKKGVGAVLDLQSQGVCEYMHWSLGSLHVLQVIGTESIVEQKGFSHWFSMGLSQDLVRIFTVFLRAIYMMVFLVSVKGVAEGLKGIDSGGFLLGWICENKEFICSRQRSAEQAYERKQMGQQGITVAEVGEIMMRDFQGMQRYLQEREDSRYLKGRHTHIKSKLGLRRRNQRSSISHGLKVFQRSHGMKVILAKDDQRILELHRLYLHEEATRARTRCAKSYTRRKMRKQNRVEQVVTTGCNPEEKGYETIVINTCSRSRKSLPQLVEACTQKRSKGRRSGVTTIGVKVEPSDKNRCSEAKGEICRLDRVGTSWLNKSGSCIVTAGETRHKT
ncbi:hypothetical protein F2Q69_00030465 [Brassica cretica]|uniref:Uncharacterized protein n=1 Tax=Brassica cretica TaxID=69181 RepID=A0A8S9RW19_BRACR|nr:hypothetical protein F2Q69_00030465 [Brassica cretica]